MAQRLRHRADLLDARLVDPLWRAFAARALQIAAYTEPAARIEALRPGNKDRLFDGLLAAGIAAVTVTFDGSGDSGQIESIGAWSGKTAAEFPRERDRLRRSDLGRP